MRQQLTSEQFKDGSILRLAFGTHVSKQYISDYKGLRAVS